MGDPVLDQAFEEHTRDYLCSESYDFIKEVCTTALEPKWNQNVRSISGPSIHNPRIGQLFPGRPYFLAIHFAQHEIERFSAAVLSPRGWSKPSKIKQDS